MYITNTYNKCENKMKKTDKLHKEIAESSYNNFELGKEAYTKQGYLIGTTIDYAYNRSGHGEKIYAIVSNGPGILPDAPGKERNQVKEITLLFQGSTNPLKYFLGKREEVTTDWKENNFKIIKNIKNKIVDVPEQLKIASAYLQNIIKLYPHAQINIYGHSLGAMNAQYALANVTEYSKINHAHIYNSPNIYTLLSDIQKINISALYSKIYNYIDSKDFIGLYYKEGKAGVGQVFKFDGSNKLIKSVSEAIIPLSVFQSPIKPVINLLFIPIHTRLTTSVLYGVSNQHMWGGFKFDEDGNLIDKSGKRVYPLEKPEETSKFEKKLYS